MRIQGFTLIELIIVIAIIGTLTAMFIPRYIDLRGAAEESARDGVVGGVRGGITIFHGKQIATDAIPVWPEELDSQESGVCTECFSNVLEEPIDDPRWVKAGQWYTYLTSGGITMTFRYNSSNGDFLPSVAPTP